MSKCCPSQAAIGTSPVYTCVSTSGKPPPVSALANRVNYSRAEAAVVFHLYKRNQYIAAPLARNFPLLVLLCYIYY